LVKWGRGAVTRPGGRMGGRTRPAVRLGGREGGTTG